jgi:ABC-type nitrate/sulfonate/bicarbonate transport system substrate-binding protein
MTEQIWDPSWIERNPEAASKLIQMLQETLDLAESKLKHANNKIAKLESQNKEYKLTIKDMDRRIMRGLKD